MKSVYFVCSNLTSNETLISLHEGNFLIGVIIDDYNNPRNTFIIDYCKKKEINLSNNLNILLNIKVDLIIVSNYPKLIPRKILDLHNIINTHWSDLPKYRGIHSTAWAILNAEKQVAVTFHVMEEEFDTGDIIFKGYVDVDEKNLISIHKELRLLQSEIALDIVSNYQKFEDLPREKQDEKSATYVTKRYPHDGKISWNNTSDFIYRLYRILPYPDYPPAFFYFDDKKIEIVEMEKVNCPEYFCNTGTVVRSLKDGSVWVKTLDKVVSIKKINIDKKIFLANEILKRGFKLN